MFGLSIFIILALIHYLFSPLLALYSIRNDVYSSYPLPHITNISNTNETLRYPWGLAPTITVFLNHENISIKDHEKYIEYVLLASNYWENDKSHNFGYNINFIYINNSEDANIIINFKDIVYNDNIKGTTHINSTGRFDSVGTNLCDTYNTPFKQCVIEIRTDLKDRSSSVILDMSWVMH